MVSSIEEKRLVTVIGSYVFIPNPCTTKPCLPGMAYAVKQQGGTWFLTVEGKLLNEAYVWSDWTPQVGAKIAVTGYVKHLVDIFGEPYIVIEVQSVNKVK